MRTAVTRQQPLHCASAVAGLHLTMESDRETSLLMLLAVVCHLLSKVWVQIRTYNTVNQCHFFKYGNQSC